MDIETFEKAERIQKKIEELKSRQATLLRFREVKVRFLGNDMGDAVKYEIDGHEAKVMFDQWVTGLIDVIHKLQEEFDEL